MSDAVLQFRNVTKRYGGILALDDVSFDVGRGRVHAIIGENGAGKSTLMNILAGAVPRDGGRVLLDGAEVDIPSPVAAHRLGIGIVYQETMLAENLTVAENLFIGHGGFGFFVPFRRMRGEAEKALRRLDVDIPPGARVRSLSVGQKQLVQIARALVFSACILILDEPTSSLSDHETRKLFDVLRSLKGEGMTILYVSHKMKEIEELADEATVLRDGRVVDTVGVEGTSRESFIRMMVGREVKVKEYERAGAPGGEVLCVNRLTSSRFHDVSFCVRAGEVVGCFGLVGAGRSEVMRAIFGVDRFDTGEILLDGKPFDPRSPRAAMRGGVAMLPEDRKGQGLVMLMGTGANVSLSLLDRLCAASFVRRSAEAEVVGRTVERLSIRCAGPAQRVRELSGGNQQKVVLGKVTAEGPKVLILDEPTKGVDVASKAEIHDLIREYAARGLAVLLVSSELPEIQSLSDRILVFSEGRIEKEFAHGEASDGEIMTYAAGAHV